ncbi:phosphotransferase [Saxibacter everestensis]|uniref:Phosphotransferase n=1 Tax=Saxibacter everestensis TaxID=2909229 RepID=A0ABY8QTM7_9MICO|nr:phosphotransferase [Brevibacteriaceae bacterium ZFBP1038]
MLSHLLREVATNVPDPGEQVARVLEGAGSVVHLGTIWPGRAIYLLFAPGQRVPTVVLKVDDLERHKVRLRAEFANLTTVSSKESLHGTVPAPLALAQVGDKLVLAQTGIGGIPLNAVLRRRLLQSARGTERDHSLIVNWLRRFHAVSTPTAPNLLNPDVIHERLVRTLPDGPEQWTGLLSRVEGAGHDFAGTPIPQVWCHGDLGPSNCLSRGQNIGVIDWEGGPALGNPLGDLTLFLNYYARAMPVAGRKLLLHEEAFERAFLGEGWLARVTRSTFRKEMAVHGLPVEALPYLLLATLADMAGGTAGTAHSNRPNFRLAYQDRLGRYARYLMDNRLL